MSLVQQLKTGFKTAEQIMTGRQDYRHSVFDPRFARDLRQGYINTAPVARESGKRLESIKTEPLKSPAEFIGAYAARVATDIGTDGSRQFYWRYNHPLAIAEKAVEQAVPQLADVSSPLKRAALTGGIGGVTAASLGTFDVTNPGELFRPKGYAQTYAEKGSEDRRQTAEPGMELFDRFFLGRRGRPLKYETAKADIPSLTPERYGKAMRSQYQDRGLLGLGLIKATDENLQGEPELKVVGFPVGLQAAGAVAGGTTALRKAMDKKMPTRKAGAIGLAGSLAGATVGKMVNLGIASARNNPESLPSTLEY
jgi:hypothetical protein